MGDLLWADFEAWPSTTWTVLSGAKWYWAADIGVSCS